MKQRRVLELVVIVTIVACVGTLAQRFSNESAPELSSPPATTTRSGIYDSQPLEYQNRDLAVRISDPAGVLQGELPEITASRLKAGEILFEANCSACHGMSARGDGPAGQVLDPKPADLTRKENYQYGHDIRSIIATTAYGKEGTGMAPWEGILSQTDMENVAIYVHSLTKPGESASERDETATP